MAQGSRGVICLHENFIGQDDPVAGTAVPRQLGIFRVVGQGMAEADSGAPRIDGGRGVRLTTTDEAEHTLGIETNRSFVVGTMAPISLEAVVQFENLDTKTAFIGFTDIAIASDVPSIETDLMHGATTTLTLTASDLIGFYLSAELTDDEGWHMPYKGGTTAGPTVSTSVASGVDAVAGEWDVLRLDIYPDGKAQWFINGKLEQSVDGAVSTTTALKFFAAVEAKGAAVETMDLKLVHIDAFEDWAR